MPLRALFPAALALILVAAPSAAAAEYVPGEVIVKYRDGTTATVQTDQALETALVAVGHAHVIAALHETLGHVAADEAGGPGHAGSHSPCDITSRF